MWSNWNLNPLPIPDLFKVQLLIMLFPELKIKYKTPNMFNFIWNLKQNMCSLVTFWTNQKQNLLCHANFSYSTSNKSDKILLKFPIFIFVDIFL